jgi:hypothetical protein
VDLPQLLEKICALPDPAVESTTVSTFGKAFIAGVIISVPSVLLQSLC